MIDFHIIRWKNLLSTGNAFTEVHLNKYKNTLIVGENGSGKCLDKSTNIDIEFADEETMNKFKDFLA